MAYDPQGVFERIRPFFAAHAARCVVLHDEPGRYCLGTHEMRAKDGYRTMFGGVEIKKAYVSAHLIPVYVHPDMLDEIGADLRKRMQGKSCFNFKTVDDELFAGLRSLIDAGATRFQQNGWI